MATTSYTPGNRRCCGCRRYSTEDHPIWIHDCTLFSLCGNYVCKDHCFFADCVDIPVVLCSKHYGYLSRRCTPFSYPDAIETVFATLQMTIARVLLGSLISLIELPWRLDSRLSVTGLLARSTGNSSIDMQPLTSARRTGPSLSLRPCCMHQSSISMASRSADTLEAVSDAESELQLALTLAEPQPGEPAAHAANQTDELPAAPAGMEPASANSPFAADSFSPQGMAAHAAPTQEPGEPAPRKGGKGVARDVPPTMHPSARSFPHVPQVGEEIAMLGPELGTALRQRRTAERRSIFAQRGTLGPDDSPFQHLSFDPSIDYRGVEWGQPVPQEEWERR
eukprot:908955-Amphidinium_carterae.1